MSKFKVGDWVISTRGNIEQITCIAPRGCGNYYGEAEDIIINYRDSNDYDFIDSGVELWQPQVGEWCWFTLEYDPGDFEHPTLMRYGEHPKEIPWIVEPFIGTLPSFIKGR